MHEVSCPACNAATQYDLRDYLLLCPFCSATFHLDFETGRKDLYSDHFIVPNSCDQRQIKSIFIEWIRRLHHNPDLASKEYLITEIAGYSIPFWIISVEAHTQWKGLIKRESANMFDVGAGGNYLSESGMYRRNYRWAVSSRKNIAENWGLLQLHEPKEPLDVDWDGFPLDSTLSRGRIDENLGIKVRNEQGVEEERTAYDVREPFDFKFSNSLPILAIQVPEEEALRRARHQIERYHVGLSKLHCDILVDNRIELEVAGIQLVHLPFWFARYIYQPRGLLRHFQKPKERNLIFDGYAGGILKSEMAIVKRDKLWINTAVCVFTAAMCVVMGVTFHGSFILVAVFCLIVAVISGSLALKSQTEAASEGDVHTASSAS